MNVCGYCGAQNGDRVLRCEGCGNPFRVDSANQGPALMSPLASEVATGAGVLLIIMALFFAIGRIWGDTGTRSAVVHKNPLYTLVTTSTPAPFIALVAIYPVFVLWRARFGKSRAVRATVLISLIGGVLWLLPKSFPYAMFVWCLPAVVFGVAAGSIGFYFGALVQLAFGVSMLIRFRPRRNQEAPAA